MDRFGGLLFQSGAAGREDPWIRCCHHLRLLSFLHAEPGFRVEWKFQSWRGHRRLTLGLVLNKVSEMLSSLVDKPNFRSVPERKIDKQQAGKAARHRACFFGGGPLQSPPFRDTNHALTEHLSTLKFDQTNREGNVCLFNMSHFRRWHSKMTILLHNDDSVLGSRPSEDELPISCLKICAHGRGPEPDRGITPRGWQCTDDMLNLLSPSV